jgi:hypothetical protein
MADKDFDYGLPTPGMLGEDPELHKRPVWYGYVTTDGQGHVKRYLSWLDYKEAGDSDLVSWTTWLFEAPDREAAVKEFHRLAFARTRF